MQRAPTRAHVFVGVGFCVLPPILVPPMYMAFLDEFGHIGPFVSATAPRYNESPVFGLAGYVLPESEVRGFATWFFQLKGHFLRAEIQASGVHPATWEKKGTELFDPRTIRNQKEARRIIFRLINKIVTLQGKLFYYGREKLRIRPEEGRPMGLYKTVLPATIRKLDAFCVEKNQNFIIIMDAHTSRRALLESAAKTMFGRVPARKLIEPPFEVESNLYQTVQAADWIAAIIGRIWNYRLRPSEYPFQEPFQRFFWERLVRASTHSSVFVRRPSQPRLPNV